uniref:Uncharacterized protein n=1 Tax=Oryza glumipatula TaxID=40148 RepID=A0A0E0AGE2_9ORYZ
MVDFLIGLLRVPAGLAARVLARHGVTAPGSLATLYAGARALNGRLLRPRAAARPLRPRSPAACRRRSRVLAP